MGINVGHKLKLVKRIKEIRRERGMYVPESRQGARPTIPNKEASKPQEQPEPNSASGGVGTDNGGSLLDGFYDEEEQARQFQEALKAWRN